MLTRLLFFLLIISSLPTTAQDKREVTYLIDGTRIYPPLNLPQDRIDTIFFYKTVSPQDTIYRPDTTKNQSIQKPPFIHVYPNPVIEDLTLQVDSAFFPYTFAVHDFAGRLVHLEENIQNFEHYPDLRHLPKAVFLARIISRNEIEWKGKLVKR